MTKLQIAGGHYWYYLWYIYHVERGYRKSASAYVQKPEKAFRFCHISDIVRLGTKCSIKILLLK